jgi:hypothetical protein
MIEVNDLIFRAYDHASVPAGHNTPEMHAAAAQVYALAAIAAAVRDLASAVREGR